MDSPDLHAGNDTSRKTALQGRMDALVGYILGVGVLLSVALLVAGLIWKWTTTGKLAFDYRLIGMNLFQFAAGQYRLAAHGAIRPRLLVNWGIIVLMLTPYFRVLASVVYFMAVVKNWKYSLFTSVVLVVLTYSLFLR
jgi:uncharacterized membrane protein